MLDEPFSQIDNFKKNSLQRNLFSYLKQKNIACIIATHDGDDALSFADKMIVIQNHQIIAKGTPSEIYNNPKNNYVATLFDDVNEIALNQKIELLYPHQIKLVDNSDLKAIVLNTYFKGSFWLIEADFDGQKVFVNHPFKIKVGDTIFIQVVIPEKLKI